MKSSAEKTTSRRRLLLGGITVTFAVSTLGACAGPSDDASVFPGRTWMRYATPEEAGWSTERLSLVESYCHDIGSAACMVVFDGAVVVAWGDISRRYMCHSVRKSYLSALYGIHVGEGTIDLDKTLATLGIDDDPPLMTEEKQARIVHLLQSRSGVFHAAAYETPKMKERRPERGSKKPGQYWYYNNWDFNALGTIFERETGAGIFEEFKSRIADPLQMEDFRLMDGYYHLEKQHSVHPAYPFRMSARDMARFGLLFLRNGKWEDLVIVPETWVEASRRAYTTTTHWQGFGYGYMWWVNVEVSDAKSGMYAAMGYGGHMIAVLPEQNIVIVNRANTYMGQSTDKLELLGLIDKILEAKISPPEESPHFVPLDEPTTGHAEMSVSSTRLEDYTGTFHLQNEEILANTIPYVIGDMIGHHVRIEVNEGRLLMVDNLGQQFVLVPSSPAECFIEDMEIPVFFERDDQSRPIKITLDASPVWRVRGERKEMGEQE